MGGELERLAENVMNLTGLHGDAGITVWEQELLHLKPVAAGWS